MPFYDYECPVCKERKYNVLHSWDEEPLVHCTLCDELCHIVVLSPPSIVTDPWKTSLGDK